MEERIIELIKPTIEENGFILDNVEYVKEGSLYYLRITIDKKGYVDLDDCVKITKLINPIIDSNDPIKDNYILEVSSKEKGSDYNE